MSRVAREFERLWIQVDAVRYRDCPLLYRVRLFAHLYFCVWNFVSLSFVSIAIAITIGWKFYFSFLQSHFVSTDPPVQIFFHFILKIFRSLIINYYLIKSNRYDCYPIIRTTFQIPLKSQESEKKKISQTGTESTLEIHLSYEVIIDYLYKTTTTTNLLDHNHPRGTEEHEYTDRFTASYSLIHATREDNENRNQAILRYYPSAGQDPRGNNSTRL